MKPWYKSRTVWTQIITLLVAVLTALVGQDFNPKVVSALLIVLAGVNAVLRWLTDQRITSFTPRLDQLRGR